MGSIPVGPPTLKRRLYCFSGHKKSAKPIVTLLQKRKPSRHCDPSQHEESHSNIQSFKHKSNTTRHSQSQSKIRRTKRYGHKPATHKDHNNTKPIRKIIVLCNALCFKLKSKKTAKNNPSRIVIPSKTRKKILIYYLQPTLEIKFQHSKIKTQVQHATAKEHFKERITMHLNGQNTRATPKPTTLRNSRNHRNTKPRLNHDVRKLKKRGP